MFRKTLVAAVILTMLAIALPQAAQAG